MITRVLKTTKKDPNLELYEETPEKKPEYTYIKTITKTESSVNSKESYIKILIISSIKIVVGTVIALFGIFNASSMFSTSTMFTGKMATIFYKWQLAWILEIFGCIIFYKGITPLITIGIDKIKTIQNKRRK